MPKKSPAYQKKVEDAVRILKKTTGFSIPRAMILAGFSKSDTTSEIMRKVVRHGDSNGNGDGNGNSKVDGDGNGDDDSDGDGSGDGDGDEDDDGGSYDNGDSDSVGDGNGKWQ